MNPGHRHTGYRSFPSWVTDQFTGMATDPSPSAARVSTHLRQQFGVVGGIKRVGSDPERRLLQGQDFMSAHFENTRRWPGPVGHGFTQSNLDGNTPSGPRISVRICASSASDTCNRFDRRGWRGPEEPVRLASEAGLQECRPGTSSRSCSATTTA